MLHSLISSLECLNIQPGSCEQGADVSTVLEHACKALPADGTVQLSAHAVWAGVGPASRQYYVAVTIMQYMMF
jgi:hypothetical protein